MGIQVNISPRIIPSIASLYNDVNRIFLEYIDNSLDSAEQFYDQGNFKVGVSVLEKFLRIRMILKINYIY